MTVNEYRKKHRRCSYCSKNTAGMVWCPATGKRMGSWAAMTCPCYEVQPYEESEKLFTRPSAKLIRFAAFEYGLLTEGRYAEDLLRKIYEKEKNNG